MRIILLFFLISSSTAFGLIGNNFSEPEPVKLYEEEEFLINKSVPIGEFQSLLNRVEILEHNIQKLENKLQGLDSLLNVPPMKNDKEAKEPDDIFALPEKKINTSNTASNKAEANNNQDSKKNVNKSEKNDYDLALADLKSNKLNSAEAKFAAFIKKYPKSSYQSNAYFWYAETFYQRKLFDKAALNYLKGYKEQPKGAKAADSLLKLALSLGEINRKKEACSMLQKLDSEFKDRPASSLKRTKDAKLKFNCK